MSDKTYSVIGGEFLLFDIPSDKIFTMEDFDSDQMIYKNFQSVYLPGLDIYSKFSS